MNDRTLSEINKDRAILRSRLETEFVEQFPTDHHTIAFDRKLTEYIEKNEQYKTLVTEAKEVITIMETAKEIRELEASF